MSHHKDPLVEQLRQARRAAGMSLRTFAERSGIPAAVIGSYERGDRQPTVQRIRHLLSCVGWDINAAVARPPQDDNTTT